MHLQPTTDSSADIYPQTFHDTDPRSLVETQQPSHAQPNRGPELRDLPLRVGVDAGRRRVHRVRRGLLQRREKLPRLRDLPHWLRLRKGFVLLLHSADATADTRTDAEAHCAPHFEPHQTSECRADR